MVNFSVTQNGKELDPSLYYWNETELIFHTNQENLILNFYMYDNVMFKTGSHCTFIADSWCSFRTGSYCTFITGSENVFDTGYECIYQSLHDSVVNYVGYNGTHVYKLPENKIVRMNYDGSLEDVKEIQIENVEIKNEFVILKGYKREFIYNIQTEKKNDRSF